MTHLTDAPAGSGKSCPYEEFWLVVDEDGRALRVRGGGIAVFSGQNEAELFFHFGIYGDGLGCRVRHCSAGELVSMLYSSCASVQAVCLDPTPEVLAASLASLLTVGRERFIDRLTGRARLVTPSAPEAVA